MSLHEASNTFLKIEILVSLPFGVKCFSTIRAGTEGICAVVQVSVSIWRVGVGALAQWHSMANNQADYFSDTANFDE